MDAVIYDFGEGEIYADGGPPERCSRMMTKAECEQRRRIALWDDLRTTDILPSRSTGRRV